ncbi:6-phosphogluconolactonase [Agrococcus sp. HG114]|uniref:6-phosphogluconolactonase n=1 Tax=Agrococcus sp. HG114 TaxID=2969757 RepID=UPI00215B57F9|nr:6-phosphogluconolactonase [Agrococcus sp. HG114]MCR8669661.1 6-phosphogluconolactonase [Agrococcus sp. HG114]
MRRTVHADRAALVRETARELAELIEASVAARGRAAIALTGGSVGTELLAALAELPVDWSRVALTWSDERFVDAASPDRNARQAREALLDRVPIPAEHVLELPAAGATSLDEAAARASELLERLGAIDVTLLGMGPDAHVASLFPGLPGVHERGARIIAVRDSPKPPPERLSFTLDAINASDRVWLVVAGADKADAVARVLDGADVAEAPASGVAGRLETRIVLDAAAASRL